MEEKLKQYLFISGVAIFIFSLSLNLILGLNLIGGYGGSVSDISKDEKYRITLSSLKRVRLFSKSKEIYCEIKLHDIERESYIIKKIVIDPINAGDEMSYRSLKNPFFWSEDMSQVKVVTPDFTFSLNLNEQYSSYPTPIDR